MKYLLCIGYSIFIIILLCSCSFDAYYPSGDFTEYEITGEGEGALYYSDSNGIIRCSDIELPFHTEFYSTKNKSITYVADDNNEIEARIIINGVEHKKTGVRYVSIAVQWQR